MGGLCGFLDSPVSLLASFCVLAGTGNSTTTQRNYILEQNNCFSWRQMTCGNFLSSLWNSNNLGEVRVDFFSEIESCFNEIQYQET